MRKIEYATYTVTEERKSGEICSCDVCKKVIFRRSFKPGDVRHIPVSFWKITTGHNDWGNDSIDSVETFDICSSKCLNEKFSEYISGTDGARNSQYFNVEHVSGRVMMV